MLTICVLAGAGGIVSVDIYKKAPLATKKKMHQTKARCILDANHSLDVHLMHMRPPTLDSTKVLWNPPWVNTCASIMLVDVCLYVMPGAAAWGRRPGGEASRATAGAVGPGAVHIHRETGSWGANWVGTHTHRY